MNIMTVEQGYDLAKYQTPGYVVVMGVNEATTRKMDAISYQDYSKLPGPWSFLEWLIGFKPSLWSKNWIIVASIHGCEIEFYDWTFLNDKNIGIKEATQWLDRKVAELEQTT